MVASTVRHLDLNLIDELRELMEDEFSLLIDTFIDDGEARLAELPALADGSDDLRRAAHSFKGGASNMGAVELASLCARLEAMSAGGDSAATIALIDDIRCEFEAVRGALLEVR